MSLSVVVLPQPLSPTMTRNSPALTSRLAWSTAATAPKRFVNLRRESVTITAMLMERI